MLQPASTIAIPVIDPRIMKSRRDTHESRGPSSSCCVDISNCSCLCGQGHDGGSPTRSIGILLEHLVDIDDEVSARALNGQAIHAACRAPLDEDTVGAILRMVLGTLEAMIGVIPSQGR